MWRWPPLLYITARLLLAGYSGYALVHHLVDNTHTREPSVVYFSAWSYLLLALHLVSSAIYSSYFYRQELAEIVQVALPSGIQNTAADTSKRKQITAQECSVKNSQGCLNDKVDVPAEVEDNVEHASGMTSCDRVGQAYGSSDFDFGSDSMESADTLDNDSRLKELQELHSTYESFSNFRSINIESGSTKWYFKVSWCLSNVASASAPVATVLFFSVVHPQLSKCLDLPNVNVQILNIIFVIIDHMISARPIRLLHAIASIVFGLIYIIFSLIYWSTSESNPVIYDVILDWANPEAPIGFTLGLSLVVFPILQLTYFGIYKLKEHIHMRIYGVPFEEITY